MASEDLLASSWQPRLEMLQSPSPILDGFLKGDLCVQPGECCPPSGAS